MLSHGRLGSLSKPRVAVLRGEGSGMESEWRCVGTEVRWPPHVYAVPLQDDDDHAVATLTAKYAALSQRGARAHTHTYTRTHVHTLAVSPIA